MKYPISKSLMAFAGELLSLFRSSISFSFPYHLSCQTNALLDGLITSVEGNLITSDYLKALIGSAEDLRGKWVSNFVMDEYLLLVKSACANKGLTFETLSWETFDKAAGSVSAALLIGKYSLLLQDAVLVPGNTTQSEHWSLLSVLRKEKCATFLDSKAGNY